MKSAIKLSISERVKEYRLAKGWSHRYLGDCLNVSHTFIIQIEDPTSDKAYNFDHINALAKIFDCKIWDLIPEYPLYDENISR